MKQKFFGTLALVGAAAVCLAGCGSSAASAAAASTAVVEQTQAASTEGFSTESSSADLSAWAGGTVLGSVVSADDSTVTVSVAMGRGQGEKKGQGGGPAAEGGFAEGTLPAEGDGPAEGELPTEGELPAEGDGPRGDRTEGAGGPGAEEGQPAQTQGEPPAEGETPEGAALMEQPGEDGEGERQSTILSIALEGVSILTTQEDGSTAEGSAAALTEGVMVQIAVDADGSAATITVLAGDGQPS